MCTFGGMTAHCGRCHFEKMFTAYGVNPCINGAVNLIKNLEDRFTMIDVSAYM